MKQKTSLFYLITLLAILSLTGVKYLEPFTSGDVGHPVDDWDDFQRKLDQDTGVEMWFPMLSLVFFVLCTILITVTERFRVLVFSLALANVLYTISIGFATHWFVKFPYYRMENGYLLHLLASFGLQILAVSYLNSRDRSAKRRKVDHDLLDDTI